MDVSVFDLTSIHAEVWQTAQKVKTEEYDLDNTDDYTLQ
jgi:hypothetical protein